jgi:hypothetical protein
MRSVLVAFFVLAGCGLGRPAPSAVPGLVTFEGTCDASGAVPLDAQRFAVADDENNVVRIYDAERGGPPLSETDLTPELGGTGKKKKKKAREADLEAATRFGDIALFISSHARSKKGKDKPERARFFATTLPNARGGVLLTGTPYHDLARDLAADARLQALGIPTALERAPQAAGGFNIEGMTATLDDSAVLIGFRNPVPEGRALIVPLENPREVINAGPARFGAPILLDLGGLGVRSLSSWRGQYLIAAGAFGEGGERARLFRWQGPGTAAEALPNAALLDLNPEGFFTPEGRGSIMVLSDDGARTIEGERCKDLEEPGKKRFRGLWLAMP